MEPELSIHDNCVYAYSVDCKGRRLTLHTEFKGREPQEYTDVVFRDVLAHHFDHVQPGNILFDVEEQEIGSLVRENAVLFADSWRYGWPLIEYSGDLDVLVTKLKAASVRAYSIGSSYGMSGWVLAGSCELVSRDGPAQVA